MFQYKFNFPKSEIALIASILLFAMCTSRKNECSQNAPHLSSKKLVEAFLMSLDKGEFECAYAMSNNPNWGGKERFCSTEGFGGIADVHIDTIYTLNGMPSAFGDTVVYANYFASDPSNKDGQYQFYFHVLHDNDNFSIVRATKSHLQRNAIQKDKRLGKAKMYSYKLKKDGISIEYKFDLIYPTGNSNEEWINHELLKWLGVEKPDGLEPDDVIDLIKSASEKTYQSEMNSGYVPNGRDGPFIHNIFSIGEQLGKYVTLRNDYHGYSWGAAHDYYGKACVIFDVEERKVILITDIFNRKDSEEKIISSIEEQLRKHKLFAEDEELHSMNNIIDLDRLGWEITENGMRVHFNPYVITPFAMGAFEIMLYWRDIVDYLEDNFRNSLNL